MSLRSVTSFRWVACALLVGCTPADDDDSSLADDDDSAAVGDDDDTGDDDSVAGDDDTATGGDYDAATPPSFEDCSGNQIKMMLGDGTELTAQLGLDPLSFSNNNGQFSIRVGDPALGWAQLNGHRTGMVAGSPITLQGPPSEPGHVVLASFVDPSLIGAAPASTAGAFGMPPFNGDERVGGFVSFDSLPEPGVLSSGRFEAILQSNEQLAQGHTVLLGVSGCFEATLEATDTGGEG